MNTSTNASVATALAYAAAQVPRLGNLTVLNFTQNLSILAFDPSITNITLLDTAIDNIFSPQTFSAPQLCVYAISGSYGFLSRLLFYCILIFALISRWHSWLSAAALGIAMTYSSIACVHAFALLIRYKYHYNPDHFEASNNPKYSGDIDLWGIFPILIAACVMLTPLLNWSYALRMREVHNARPIVILWGVLIFGALVPTMFAVLSGSPFEIPNGLATCTLDLAQGCSYQAFVDGTDGAGNIFQDNYDRCSCTDTCATIQEQNTPFRKTQQLQAYLTRRKVALLNDRDGFDVVAALNYLILFVIIMHGAFGLVEVHWTQAQLRNKLFLWMAGRTEFKSRPGWVSKTRYVAAKVFTTAGYTFAILMAVLCPLVFVASIVINEILTWPWPSVGSDDIGEWGPWVGAAFAIIAAIMQQYWDTWQRFIVVGLNATYHVIKRDRNRAEKKAFRKARNTDESVAANIIAFIVQVSKPFVWFWRMTWEFWDRIVLEMKDFARWFKDPIESSLNEPYYWSDRVHTIFKEVKVHTLGCDGCRHREEIISYQCDDCALRYCSECWPTQKKAGAHLKYGERPHDVEPNIPKNLSRIGFDSHLIDEKLQEDPHLGLIHARTAPAGATELIPPVSSYKTPLPTCKNPHADMPDKRPDIQTQDFAFRLSNRRSSTNFSQPDPRISRIGTDERGSPQQTSPVSTLSTHSSPVSPAISPSSPPNRRSSVMDSQPNRRSSVLVDKRLPSLPTPSDEPCRKPVAGSRP